MIALLLSIMQEEKGEMPAMKMLCIMSSVQVSNLKS